MQGPCRFTLLVPSTPHGITWAADMHGGGDEAEGHRTAFLQELREEGLNVSDAKVGDPDPLAAIQDECNFNEYDEVIVSTRAECGTELIDAEIQAPLDSGGPFLWTVHANEQVAPDDEDPEA